MSASSVSYAKDAFTSSVTLSVGMEISIVGNSWLKSQQMTTTSYKPIPLIYCPTIPVQAIMNVVAQVFSSYFGWPKVLNSIIQEYVTTIHFSGKLSESLWWQKELSAGSQPKFKSFLFELDRVPTRNFAVVVAKNADARFKMKSLPFIDDGSKNEFENLQFNIIANIAEDSGDLKYGNRHVTMPRNPKEVVVHKMPTPLCREGILHDYVFIPGLNCKAAERFRILTIGSNVEDPNDLFVEVNGRPHFYVDKMIAAYKKFGIDLENAPAAEATLPVASTAAQPPKKDWCTRMSDGCTVM